MAILFAVAPPEEPRHWIKHLEKLLPGEEFRIWPEVGARADVEVVLVWRPPKGSMSGYPNLRMIHNLGAGVDAVIGNPELPDVPLASMKDDGLRQGMIEYVLHAVLHLHRDMHRYAEFQREGRWKPMMQADTGRRRIGILGLGHLGGTCAEHLVRIGFPVAGWSRTRKSLAGIESFAGLGELPAFLARTDILVVLAPLTAETRGIVSAVNLAHLPTGAYLVNAARGPLIVEKDVLAALDSGSLAGAFLDVFETEPLPAGHPFWTHPKVIVTPHVAALNLAGPGSARIAENIKRVRAGLPPVGLVDKTRGY